MTISFDRGGPIPRRPSMLFELSMLVEFRKPSIIDIVRERFESVVGPEAAAEMRAAYSRRRKNGRRKV